MEIRFYAMEINRRFMGKRSSYFSVNRHFIEKKSISIEIKRNYRDQELMPLTG
jgi:hypothetical protein